MLIDMHRTHAAPPDVGIGIPAGQILPRGSRARGKPDLERVEEDPVGVIRIHGDSLIVPVLVVIARARRGSAVSERAALRTVHIRPGGATISRSPSAQLASKTITATSIVIPSN